MTRSSGSRSSSGGARSAAATSAPRIGVVARMVQVEALPGGRYAVVAVGTRRFRVNAWLPDDPYPLADVDEWRDLDPDAPELAGAGGGDDGAAARDPRPGGPLRRGAGRTVDQRGPAPRVVSPAGPRASSGRRTGTGCCARRRRPSASICSPRRSTTSRRCSASGSPDPRRAGPPVRDRTSAVTATQEELTPQERRDAPPTIAGAVDLVKAYAKQETIGPLKGAGRWIGMGMAGALTLGLGLSLILLGLLRLLQTEWDRSATRLALVAVLRDRAVVCLGLIALVVSRINKDSAEQGTEVGEQMAKQAVAPNKITRDDLEQRFRSIQEDAKAKVNDKKSTIATVAGIGGRPARAARVRARPAQREEEDHPRRDPPGLSRVRATPGSSGSTARRLWPWQLRRRSVARGLIQGRRGWQIVARGSVRASAGCARRCARAPEVVATARLEPGAAVTHRDDRSTVQAGQVTPPLLRRPRCP